MYEISLEGNEKSMKAKTNPVLYLLNDLFFAFLVLLLSPFCKNSTRYPDKKNLKELLKISNPFVVSYHIATRKKEIKVI